MSVTLVNSFLNGIVTKKSFLPECLLYIGMHVNYLDIQMLRAEKKYFTPNSENELKYFTILTILRMEHNLYTKLFKLVQNNHYYEALSFFSARMSNRDECLLYYLRSSRKAKVEYRLTRRKGMKYISQGYEKVVKILITMTAFVEEEFYNVVNNNAIQIH